MTADYTINPKASGRTVGYVIQDLTPEGSHHYLAKCGRCAWSGTFGRTNRDTAEADLLRHLTTCRGDR